MRFKTNDKPQGYRSNHVYPQYLRGGYGQDKTKKDGHRNNQPLGKVGGNEDKNGFFNVVQPCVMPMISGRKGGRIIAVSSVSGVTGNRGQVNYSAAKAGLIGAVKALAVELAKRKITVNCIAPGLIETEILEMNEIALKTALSMIPMQWMGQPQEVANLVSFLVGEQSSYITRQVISINGGMV